MKIKHHRIILAGVMKTLFIGLMFITISIGHAQSLQNWSDPVNLSNSGAATNPSFVIDSTGIFHVIWVDEIDGYKYVQSEDGTNWTSPIIVNFPFLIEDNLPKFIADPNGSIHAFWRDEENALYYSVVNSENFGNSGGWRTKTQLAEAALDLFVVLDSKETLHLGYIRNISTESDPAGIYYRRSQAGSSWSPGQNLYTSEYFRSLEPENAHIRLSTVSGEIDDEVYIIWDDRPQKRIFMVTSIDSGQTWNEAEQIKGPEETTSYKTPHHGEISAFGKTILLLWQVGESGNQCVQYSQFFFSESDAWGEPIKVLDENLGCPDKTEIFTLDQNYALLFLQLQGDISFIAWNGNQWSDPKIQKELLEFYNPVTFDPIILGCPQLSLHENSIYIVGCDQGNSYDIWFSSRSLDSVENWYPSLSDWNTIGLITNTEQVISSLTSIADLDSVHLVWVQSTRSQTDGYVPTIQYSRWNDGRWSSPRTIISNLSGKPLHISVAKDREGRLLLVWQDEMNGNIYFSWADAGSASLSTEWIQPEIVPSVSRLNSTPEILVDASGRIIIMYSVSANENRGLYIVQSTDLGNTWSSPLSVFDAVSAGWEMISHPKISLSGDGRLHLLFNRDSLRTDDQLMGLYYMQSIDGGVTWSEPELVREGLIAWSDIYSYDRQSVHRFWQEKNGLEVSHIDQFSSDAGITWEAPVKIISASEETTQVSLAMDQVGGLYLAQLTYGEDMSLQDWKWDGSRWILQRSKELDFGSNGDRYSITNSVTSNGNSIVSISFENVDLAGNITNEIWSLYRILDVTEITQDPQLAIIPTPKPRLTTTEIPNVIPTSNVDVSPLSGLNDSPSVNRKNFVGWFLVVAVLILTVVIIRPKRKK